MTNTTDIETRRVREREKYLALTKSPTYGATNHGRDAYPLVIKQGPRFVVDFGCGRNDFVRGLRRQGVDGLGIDFAFEDADIVAAMHRVPVASGVADVVTSFDALEHLLTEDVPIVLDEMRRVARPGGRFVLSIARRQSRITVNGEGLHPTVRPLRWWLAEIARVGKVNSSRPFIEGCFHA
jgi:SAM-dependent methyltransferase